MQTQRPIVVVGSINMDVVASVQTLPAAGETVTGSRLQYHPGGKGANQAVAVARLGYPVRLVGCVGNDTFGASLVRSLAEAGVETSGVLERESPSGVALILVADSGQNTIVVTPGANALLTPEDLDAQVATIRAAGIVLAQLEVPVRTVEHLAELCARENVPLILDPAPAQALSPALLQRVAWFTPNQTEAAFYTRGAAAGNPADTAAHLLRSGPRGLILKLGEAGAYLAMENGTGQAVAPFAVEAVDATAAGDAFNGGFATGLMLGESPAAAARFASAVAALSVTRAGAQPSMPTHAELDAFLQARLR